MIIINIKLFFIFCISGSCLCNKVSSDLSVVQQSKRCFVFPSKMIPNETLLQDFEAVSSHGRNDASMIENVSTSQLLMRSFYLFTIFLPITLTSGIAYLSEHFRNTVWYNWLASSLANGGAAFIKWGQWSSTRPDMFPEELCVALSKLHSKAPSHSYAFTQSQMLKEFGVPAEEVFEEFDPLPIASGSIAQVYRAQLNGRTVAVKVRHPNVVEQIQMDFIIMKHMALLLESITGPGWLHLSESLQQFSHTIASQTRLDIEGKHLYLFNKNFRSWRDVSFPKPIVLTESILIETWEPGVSVSEFTELYNSARVNGVTKGVDNGEPLRTDDSSTAAVVVKSIKADTELAHFIVSRGEDIYLKMLLADNLMHADLHPGNILIHTTTEHKIVLVDAGMVAKLLDAEKENFIGFLEALGEGNGAEAATHVLQFSSNLHPDTNKAAFTEDMDTLFKRVCRGYGTHVDIGNVLRSVLKLIREHRISIDVNYATLIMNVLCLDGLAQSLIPGYNILDAAKPLLQFHRFCKKSVGLFAFNAAAPLARFFKKRSDRAYFEKFMKVT